jgi:predicted HTH domain antitoxin
VISAVANLSVVIELPSEFAKLLDPTGAHLSARIRETLAIELFRQGTISSGRAAELLGGTKDDFLALLGRFGVPYLDQTPDELLEDLQASAEARSLQPR